MMKTKVLLCSVIVLGLLAGCNGYEDGPAISLRSKHNRMQFTRPITYYTVDGVDSLQGLLKLFQDSLPSYYNGNFHFEGALDNQEHYISDGSPAYNTLGFWSGGFDSKKISLLISRHQFKICCWEVLRLSHRDLWLRQNRNGNVLELRFEE